MKREKTHYESWNKSDERRLQRVMDGYFQGPTGHADRYLDLPPRFEITRPTSARYTELSRRDGDIPLSCLGGSWFEPRPAHRLFCLEGFLGFVVPPHKVPTGDDRILCHFVLTIYAYNLSISWTLHSCSCLDFQCSRYLRLQYTGRVTIWTLLWCGQGNDDDYDSRRGGVEVEEGEVTSRLDSG